ncbi:TDP-N-acetylfucosamine:lipid II N-acetylfucosaminyltransferase [Bacilliculturomica massiliensis]|uniref:TDP-N-acetylfucosamine:lipid II N-acetylfucosaminyltransferase n=1 Tax=Bacilliculturomica massiliensis TaxID=1917867 RepID=UPI001030D713|nr:TDP-N-acetylfucosamine:lipid II N-acetylfucosaminyltransferase [Bacilliculturomica massiliensis]
MKCLHFMHDSAFCQKILLEMQEMFPNDVHTFFIITNANELKFIKQEEIDFAIKLIKVPQGMKKCFALHNKELKKVIPLYDRIYVHYLDNWSITWITRYIKPDQKLYWIVWGGDLYSKKKRYFYEKETYQLIKYDCLREFLKNLIYMKMKRIRFMHRVDYVCTSYDGDFNFFKECYPNVSSEHLHFVFPQPIELDRMRLEKHKQINSETRILVGNSADPSNNHVEVFQMLKNLKGEFRVFCPLSYGDNKYADKVIERGKSILGQRFIPIVKYMNPDDYYSFLNGIDIAIMNHKMQQAGGNILTLLYLGKTLYMCDTSVFQDIINNNGHAFPIGDLKNISGCSDIAFLNKNQINDNKKYVEKFVAKKNRMKAYEVIFGGN